MQKESYVGVGFIMFGLVVGGAGVATAGVGIGIPIIPIGIYLVWRGFERTKRRDKGDDPFSVEKSPNGKIGIGILLVLVGVATSAWIIGVPILIYGIYLIYSAIRAKTEAQTTVQSRQR